MANVIEINDIFSEELIIYSQLSERQLAHYYEPDEGIFIAESPRVIALALDAGYIPISMLLERTHITGQTSGLINRCTDIPIFTASEEILTKITGFKLTRGALCAMKRRPPRSVNEVCENAKLIAVLENVVNPTNIGAIIRSAAALNIDAVLLTPSCSDPLYRRALRVSMGTAFQIPWTYFSSDDSDKWQRQLHDHGFKTAAMALTDNSVSISDQRLTSEEKLALVLGTEGDGLSAKTINSCDYTVKIPMYHGVDSLNVAAASAVAFWQLAANK